MPNVNTIVGDRTRTTSGWSDLHPAAGQGGAEQPQGVLLPAGPRRVYTLTGGWPAPPAPGHRELWPNWVAALHIAMQDLDIRGAGNLLGAEQSADL